MIPNDPKLSFDDLEREITAAREYRENLIKREEEAVRKEERPSALIIRIVGMILTLGSVGLLFRQGLTLETFVFFMLGLPPMIMWIQSDKRKKQSAEEIERLNLEIEQLHKKRRECGRKR